MAALPPSAGNHELPIDATTLWELLPDGLVLVEPDGRIVAINPAVTAMFGHDAPSLIGRPVEALVAPHQRGDHASERRRFGAAPDSRPMVVGRVFEAYRHDRSTFPVQIALAPVEFRNRTPTLAVIRDLSQRAARAEMLAEVHDSAVQHLFGLAMHLKSIAAESDERTAVRLESVVEGLGSVLDELASQRAGDGP